MKTALLFIFLSIAAKSAVTISDYDANRIADAIRKAEGVWTYGIKTIAVTNEAQARRICLNTIRNNYKRWIKAGQPNDFISFLGNRYCPIGASNDPSNLNSNWIRNVKFFLNKCK